MRNEQDYFSLTYFILCCRLNEWMSSAEACLQSVEPREEDILRLEADLQEFRPVLDNINLIGPQLCQVRLKFERSLFVTKMTYA